VCDRDHRRPRQPAGVRGGGHPARHTGERRWRVLCAGPGGLPRLHRLDPAPALQARGAVRARWAHMTAVWSFSAVLGAWGISATLPLWAGTPYGLELGISVALFAVLSTGLNLVYGYTGLLSFAQVAYFGIAGYTSALLWTNWGFPVLAGALVGGVLA